MKQMNKHFLFFGAVIILATIAGAHAAQVNISNQLLYWNFNLNTSNNQSVYDLSGNFINGLSQNGAFLNYTNETYQFDGQNDYIIIGAEPKLNFSGNTAKFSVCVWFYPFSNTSGWILANNYNNGANNGYAFEIRNSANTFRVWPGSGATADANSSLWYPNIWQDVCFALNGTRVLFYVNGTLQGNASYTATTPTTPLLSYVGRENGASKQFNGTFDELRIWNRTITAADAQDYHNAGRNGSSTTTSVLANFSNSLGTIKGYGVTSAMWMGNESWIDTNQDGTLDTRANYTWNREAATNASINYFRKDAAFENKFWHLIDGNAETYNTTTVANASVGAAFTTTGEIPVGWTPVASGTTTNRTGNISSSTISHSGTYAINLSNTGTTGVISSRQAIPTLPLSHIYNISVWINTSATITLHLQRQNDSVDECAVNSTGTAPAWKQISCATSNLTSSPTSGYYLLIDTDAGEQTLWDDANITQDSQDLTFYKTSNASSNSNINNDISMVEWAHTNGYVVNYEIKGMPTYFAKVNSSCTSDFSSCDAQDPNAFALAWRAFFDNITNNGAYNSSVIMHFGNEPYGSEWLSNEATDALTKVAPYNALYAVTRNVFLQKYPNAVFGGPEGFQSRTNMTSGFIRLNGNNTSTFSVHDYQVDSVYGWEDEVIDSNYRYLQTLCNQYSITTCPTFVIDEWNFNNRNIQNQSNPLYAQTAAGWIRYASKYPTAYSEFYQWAEKCTYNSSASTCYPEYPDRWTMVEQYGLGTSFYSSYNATKDVASYLPPSTISVNVSSDNLNLLIGCNSNSNKCAAVNKGYQTNISFSPQGITNPYSLLLSNGTTVSYNIATGLFSNIYLLNNATTFFEIQTDTTAPSIAVSSPVNGTNYGSTNITITFNVTDSQGGITTVWWNNGTANVTLYNGSAVSGFNYTNTTIINAGNRTITIYANDSYNQLTTTTVNFLVAQIRFNSTSPSSPVTIPEPTSQTFSYVLDNPANQTVTTSWFVDGVNQTDQYNNTSFTVTTNLSSSGTYNITALLQAASNNLTNYWMLIVTDTPTPPEQTCTNVLSGFSTFAGFFGAIFAMCIMIFVAYLVVAVKDGGINASIDFTSAFQSLFQNGIGWFIMVMIVILAVAVIGGMAGLCV